MPKTRHIALIAAAVAGTASLSHAQSVNNGSFETLAGPGQFLWEDWLNFGNAGLNEADVVPFDGALAVKTFGEFFYAFPFGLDGVTDAIANNAPSSSVPFDTLPANNTVVLQIVGEDDGVDESFVGECLRATAYYYQRSDLDQLDPAGNIVQLALNFRDEGFPAPTISDSFARVDITSVANDEWVEVSVEAIAPPGTDFAEVLLLHFQFPTDYSPVDANGDGVQDTLPNGFPAFDIVDWGMGSANWDFVSLELAPGGCAAPCLGDWNNSGNEPDIFDILAYLESWNMGDPAADLDGMGGNTIFDILDFLAAWNAGCGG